MNTIFLLQITGSFAENKDIAREIRIKHILPFISKKKEIILDFTGVENATQSFIHAMISDVIRKYGIDALDLIVFKGCNSTIKTIIEIVCEYMQEGARIIEESIVNSNET
ncbi:MAG: STAS-like domain-containing protein [Candidatus Aminicenantes bacterium]|nr:STAS-like domain-containing protein [Candidatus Aminicenantes bacterium]